MHSPFFFPYPARHHRSQGVHIRGYPLACVRDTILFSISLNPFPNLHDDPSDRSTGRRPVSDRKGAVFLSESLLLQAPTTLGRRHSIPALKYLSARQRHNLQKFLPLTHAKQASRGSQRPMGPNTRLPTRLQSVFFNHEMMSQVTRLRITTGSNSGFVGPVPPRV